MEGRLFINDSFIETDLKKESINPATLQSIGEFSLASSDLCQEAVRTVTVNDHMFSFVEPGALWGGVKQTGIGRSHGPYGLMEQVNIKYISEDYSRKKTQMWWYPYHKDLVHIFKTAIHIFHHGRFRNRLRALPGLLPFISLIQKGSPLGNYIKRIPQWLKK